MGVSPVPDVIVQNRNPDQDEFNIVASIFDEGECDVGLVCEEILDQCLHNGSKDNMTALLVKMPAQEIGRGGGVALRRTRREEEQANEQKLTEEITRQVD